MSQMIRRKQTRIHLSKGRLILSVLLLALTLWPHPRIAQAQWATSGNNVYTADGGNDVGIGTGFPAYKLHIIGDLGVDAGRQIFARYSSDETYKAALSWNALQLGNNGLNYIIAGRTATNGSLIFVTNNTNDFKHGVMGHNGIEAMALTANGNVGIGTSSPQNTLHLDTSAGPVIRLTRTGFPSAFKIDTDGSSGAIATDTGHPLVFRTSSMERMRIDPNGNVGIGTTSPPARLTVGDLSSQNTLMIRGDVTTNNAPVLSLFRGGNKEDFIAQIATDGMAFGITNGLGSDYSDANLLSKTNFMISNSGNVGIGTTNPYAKLDIKTTGQLVNFDNGSGSIGNIDWGGGGANNRLILRAGAGKVLSLGAGNNFDQLYINTDGSVGIGTTAPDSTSKLTVNGNVTVTGNIAAKYQDVAEWVTSPKSMPAGTVVVLDTAHTNQVLPSVQAYDTRVAGVVSDMPGIILGEAGDGKVKVATTGRVKVKVDATKKSIQVGDLLVTSDKEGVAMKSEPLDLGGVPIHRPGTLIGKALEPLSEGEGEILVLLSLQ